MEVTDFRAWLDSTGQEMMDKNSFFIDQVSECGQSMEMLVDGIKIKIEMAEGRPFALEQKDHQNSKIFESWSSIVNDKLSSMEVPPGLPGFTYLFEKYVLAKSKQSHNQEEMVDSDQEEN